MSVSFPSSTRVSHYPSHSPGTHMCLPLDKRARFKQPTIPHWWCTRSPSSNKVKPFLQCCRAKCLGRVIVLNLLVAEVKLQLLVWRFHYILTKCLDYSGIVQLPYRLFNTKCKPWATLGAVCPYTTQGIINTLVDNTHCLWSLFNVHILFVWGTVIRM